LADLTEARLLRASKLTSLLVDEGKRWVETVAALKEEIKCSIGDVFIASACISYTGPFTGTFRHQILDHWIEQIKEREIPISDHFSVIK
jgi:dynein heavy chain, axonemal